uniref:Uncharacterized protein n=1 Tax=Pseudo-nitzschia australis TaxID=44445 RepID=A0A7S4EKL0_9STRA
MAEFPNDADLSMANDDNTNNHNNANADATATGNGNTDNAIRGETIVLDADSPADDEEEMVDFPDDEGKNLVEVDHNHTNADDDDHPMDDASSSDPIAAFSSFLKNNPHFSEDAIQTVLNSRKPTSIADRNNYRNDDKSRKNDKDDDTGMAADDTNITQYGTMATKSTTITATDAVHARNHDDDKIQPAIASRAVTK